MLPSLGTSDSWEKVILQDLLTEALFNSSSPTGNQDSPKPLKEHSPLPHTEVYFEETDPNGDKQVGGVAAFAQDLLFTNKANVGEAGLL